MKNSFDSSQFRDVPPYLLAIFLLSVFLIFSTFGFAFDAIDMGHEPVSRFVISVIMSGFFPACYAFAGTMLRKDSWKALVPLIICQFLLSSLIVQWLPDLLPVGDASQQMHHLHARLVWDSVASMVGISLGYVGFLTVSISSARRYGRTLAEKTQLESELAAVREVQQVIVPASGEVFPGFLLESVYRPARDVGGDFFQVLPVSAGGLVVVFGDVAGKGLPAAMHVALLVGAIRAAVQVTSEPAAILASLQEVLAGRSSAGFTTAIAAHIAHNGLVTLANAGHLHPYLDGQELDLLGALPLGLPGGDGLYDTTRFDLPLESRLTFLSDGVVEACDAAGNLLGFDETLRLSTQSAAAIAEAAVAFGQKDDITVLTIQRLAYSS